MGLPAGDLVTSSPSPVHRDGANRSIYAIRIGVDSSGDTAPRRRRQAGASAPRLRPVQRRSTLSRSVASMSRGHNQHRPMTAMMVRDCEAPLAAAVGETSELQPTVRWLEESGSFCGAPGRARTCNPRLRRPVLYPIELRALVESTHVKSDFTRAIGPASRSSR